MRYVKKGVLVLFLLVMLSFSVSAAANFSAQDGYDWLARQASSEGAFSSDVYLTSLSVLALDNAGYDMALSQSWLLTQADAADNYCLPLTSCDVQSTSATVLAFNELQDESLYDAWEAWYADILDNADTGGGWYLEVVTSSSGMCTISYDLNDELVEVEIEVDAGSFPSCDGSNFLDLDSCIQSNLITTNPGIILDVDCGELGSSTVLTVVYISDSTYFIVDNVNGDKADFQINNGCFGKTDGAACNQEASLWASWALDTLGSEVNTLIFLKESYDDADAFEAAMLTMLTGEEGYAEDLVALQKSDGSFDRDVFTTGLATLALDNFGGYSEEVENARAFLRDEQSDEGHWAENIEATAMALYGAFGDEAVTPSSCTDGVKNGNEEGIDCGGSCIACTDSEIVDECSLDADCEFLYGDEYVCVDGSCTVDATVSGGECTTDDNCDSGQVCLEGSCIASECNYDGKCEYPDWDETSYNCPSDCSCGDSICDSYESSSGTCSTDCGGDTEPTTTTTTTTTTTDDEGSGILGIIIVLLILVLLGVGGFFAWKKGLFSKFRRKPKLPPSMRRPGVPPGKGYTPFTGRLQQQQQRRPVPGQRPPQQQTRQGLFKR